MLFELCSISAASSVFDDTKEIELESIRCDECFLQKKSCNIAVVIGFY